jgi:hypothetical protein
MATRPNSKVDQHFRFLKLKATSTGHFMDLRTIILMGEQLPSMSLVSCMEGI